MLFLDVTKSLLNVIPNGIIYDEIRDNVLPLGYVFNRALEVGADPGFFLRGGGGGSASPRN